MLMPSLHIIAGLVLLTVCGDLLVRGAIGLALKFGVSALLIGMTVVAFGTSVPELGVSLKANLSGAGGLATGNVVGSNIANMLLILGMAGVISLIRCPPLSIRRDSATLMIATVLFIGLCLPGRIERWGGAVMLILLVGIFIYTYRSDRKLSGATGAEGDDIPPAPRGLLKAIVFTLVGLAGLTFGADLLVQGGVSIAREWGVSEAVIGLTLIAVGTSLPELAASLAAALKGHADVAIGNVIGSNLLNLLFVIGAVAVIAPVDVPARINQIDNWVMLAVTLLLLFILLAFHKIGRISATGFLVLYLGYMAFQFIERGGDLAAAI